MCSLGQWALGREFIVFTVTVQCVWHCTCGILRNILQHSFFWPSGTPGIAHPGQGGIQPRTPGTVGQVFWKFGSYKLSAIWYSSPPQAEIFTFQLCPQRFSFAPRAVLQHKTAVFSFECLLSTPGNAHPGQGLDFSTHPGQVGYPGCYTRDKETMVTWCF